MNRYQSAATTEEAQLSVEQSMLIGRRISSPETTGWKDSLKQRQLDNGKQNFNFLHPWRYCKVLLKKTSTSKH